MCEYLYIKWWINRYSDPYLLLPATSQKLQRITGRMPKNGTMENNNKRMQKKDEI